MSQQILNISWFAKHQPKSISEYVFDDPTHEAQVNQWLTDGSVSGNLLLSGPAGTGKSSLASVLINAFIKIPQDFRKIKSRSVAEIDELQSFVKTRPIQSKKKIILLEEIDKLSPVSITTLKDAYLELYQGNCTFIATTNYPNKLEPAFKTRFIHMPFSGKNADGIFKRCKEVLTIENVIFDEDDLRKFINLKHKIGLRNILTVLQVNSINNKIDFANIDQEISNSEEDIVKNVLQIYNILLNSNGINKKLILLDPLKSSIANQYSSILQTVQFSQDLYWDNVFMEIYEQTQFLPIKMISSKYLETIEQKKIPSTHFVAFLYESINAIIEIY
jgi:DNA polymerase III delta prime subunit